MPRPDSASSAVIDDGGTKEEIGGDNGIENEAHQEVNPALPEPTGDADPNGETEAGETEEVSGEEGGAVEGTEQDSESGTLNVEEFKTELREQLRNEIMAELAHNPPQETKPAAPPQLTEEEWLKQEESWGVPRTAIQAMTNQSVKVINHIMSQLDQRLAKFEKSDALRSLSSEKGFTDAPRYQKDVDEFLSHYDPRAWSNPELLRRAVIYARGKNMNKNVSQARNESERNRKIAGPGRPAPAGNAMRRTVSKPLNPIQRDVASKFGLSESEYAKLKSGSKTISV